MAALEVIINGYKCKVTVMEHTALILPSETKKCEAEYSGFCDVKDTEILAFDDIICIKYEGPIPSNPRSDKMVTVIHFIQKRKDRREWINKTLTISSWSGMEEKYRQLMDILQAKFDQVAAKRPKKLIVMVNPISGKKLSVNMYDTVVLPLLKLAGFSVECIVSETPKHFTEVICSYDNKSVDGIVVMGGDGTLHEVINILIRRTQEEAGLDFNESSAVLQPVSIPIGIIPTGSGNVTAKLLTGCQDITTSTLHIIWGKFQDLDILSVHCDDKLVGYSTCIMGIGALPDMMSIADRKLRWMKTSRYKAATLMYPLRRVHYLDTEITICNRKGTSGGENNKRKDDTIEEEMINQRTSMIIAYTFDRWSQTPNSKGKMFVVMYKEMGGLQMYRTFKRIIEIDRYANDSRYCEIREAHSLIIKFKPRPNIPSVYNEMVCVDGEVLHGSKPEYVVRVLPGVINMFQAGEEETSTDDHT